MDPSARGPRRRRPDVTRPETLRRNPSENGAAVPMAPSRPSHHVSDGFDAPRSEKPVNITGG